MIIKQIGWIVFKNGANHMSKNNLIGKTDSVSSWNQNSQIIYIS